METTLYILLTIALVSRPTLCTPAPEEANSEEGREQTQIYQIYKATQNNIIQLNTEVSLINDQLYTYSRDEGEIGFQVKG